MNDDNQADSPTTSADGWTKFSDEFMRDWRARHRARVREKIAEQDRRRVESEAQALTFVVTNGKGERKK